MHVASPRSETVLNVMEIWCRVSQLDYQLGLQFYTTSPKTRIMGQIIAYLFILTKQIC